MFRSFYLSLRQLDDGPVVRVFLKSLAVTVIVLIAAGTGLYFGMHEGLPAFGRWLRGLGGEAADAGALEAALAWIGRLLQASGEDSAVANALTLILFLLAFWLLWRAIAIAVVGIFADEVVQAVEARHYPDQLRTARDVGLWRSIAMGLGSAGRAILVNILFSPVYVLFSPGAPFVFFGINAWLLGRDLGDMVAARHVPRKGLPDWRARTRVTRFVLGGLGTGLLLVPILNLAAPILGAAMATHLFHRGRRA
ncbi:EI24 domain-containing protein [Sphingosinithalassobacter sp. LHW66-3]|uniref:EI24 domain-containing protein n=1 Tax=Sphingosinithalassobacter sp. LHW66-3 TaxID=3424718 RepID=UPI003D6BD4B7